MYIWHLWPLISTMYFAQRPVSLEFANSCIYLQSHLESCSSGTEFHSLFPNILNNLFSGVSPSLYFQSHRFKQWLGIFIIIISQKKFILEFMVLTDMFLPFSKQFIFYEVI